MQLQGPADRNSLTPKSEICCRKVFDFGDNSRRIIYDLSTQYMRTTTYEVNLKELEKKERNYIGVDATEHSSENVNFKVYFFLFLELSFY